MQSFISYSVNDKGTKKSGLININEINSIQCTTDDNSAVIYIIYKNNSKADQINFYDISCAELVYSEIKTALNIVKK